MLKMHRKLLPKRLVDRVALKTQSFEHQLLKLLRGSRKLKIFHFSTISKLSFVILLAFYFAGYQPVFSIPPVRQSKVYAEFSQEQNIESESFSEPFSLPHPGYLTTSFSAWHPGIDIATGLGMPVHPVLKGKVSEVNFNFFGYGNQVKVEHEQGLSSTYSHMGRVFAKKGDLVSKNSILGEVGVTGRTTGPHTHLEMKKDESYIDPSKLLPKVPDPKTYFESIAQK
jgi:murein DD-endopeptidase MepM/ murein hydrolase activator NlpD